MENNDVELLFESNIIDKYYVQTIKNSSNELYKVFGCPTKKGKLLQWNFIKMNQHFTIYSIDNKIWNLSTNTDDKFIVKKFLKFLSEVRNTIRSNRSTHNDIPIYTKESYKLKYKIALYKIPPIPPPTNIIIYDIKYDIPKKDKNGYIVFFDHPNFRPNLTPKEVLQSGSFGGTYFRPILSGITGKYYTDVWKEFPNDWFENLGIDKQIISIKTDKSVNKYNVNMGGNLDMWESNGWITEIDPYGWFQWYCRFYLGRRTSDDSRQIKRWLKSSGENGRFRITLINKILKENGNYDDYSIGPIIRQALLHWAYILNKKDLSVTR